MNLSEAIIHNAIFGSGGDFEAGRKAEYDAFWDAYQNYGNRTTYSGAFYGSGWNKDTFRPKYPIKPVDASRMFDSCGITDLIDLLKRAGVSIDFSLTQAPSYIATYSSLTTFPEIDSRSMNSLGYLFYYNSALSKIERIILKDDGSQDFSAYTLGNCPALRDLELSGKIGRNGLDVHWSTLLTHDSLMSIINALQDKTGTTGTWTVTLGDANLAKLSEDEIGIAEGKGWVLA